MADFDDHHVLLRAERNGHADGGSTHHYRGGTDAEENPVRACVNVMVPTSPGEVLSLDGDEVPAFSKKPFITIGSNHSRNDFRLGIEGSTQERVDISVYDAAEKIIERQKMNANSSIQFGYDYRPQQKPQ